MLDKLKAKKIILASKSPRRKELMTGLGIDFESQIREVEEIYPDHLENEQIAPYLAELKAEVWKDDIDKDAIIITADTVVLLEGEILGKPKSREDGIEMLKQLSGKVHVVITGVSILSCDKQVTFADHTRVTFLELQENEIEYYMDNFNPLDKAGSYGAQDFIGFIGIEKLEGSYFNVMGLPVHRLWEELKKF